VNPVCAPPRWSKEDEHCEQAPGYRDNQDRTHDRLPPPHTPPVVSGVQKRAPIQVAFSGHRISWQFGLLEWPRRTIEIAERCRLDDKEFERPDRVAGAFFQAAEYPSAHYTSGGTRLQPPSQAFFQNHVHCENRTNRELAVDFRLPAE
jgi:hypothetical protein